MKDLMQFLFDYIMDNTHSVYCLQTSHRVYTVQRNSVYNKLWGQLTDEQRKLLEEYDQYNNQVQMEELYAMFLAAFDQSAALLQRHTA